MVNGIRIKEKFISPVWDPPRILFLMDVAEAGKKDVHSYAVTNC